MKKRNIVLITLILAVCMVSLVALIGCGEGGFMGTDTKLTGILLKVDKTTANLGDTVTLSFEPIPKDAKKYVDPDGNEFEFKESHIEFYVRKDNTSSRLNPKHQTSIAYKISDLNDAVFWAKYCPHSECGQSTELDVVSDDITVKINRNEVSTVEQLQSMTKEEPYVLMNDIDLAGVDWTPYDFVGSLEGAGHTISNLSIDNTNSDKVGLFSNVSGEISNLNMTDARISIAGTKSQVGILAGCLIEGKLDKITVSGNVDASYSDKVGGIVGSSDLSYITNSTNNATVMGQNETGGVAGYIYHSRGEHAVENNVNNGAITGNNSVGGVFGKCATDDLIWGRYMSKQTNNGVIEGANNVGGVMGHLAAHGAEFSDLHNNGEVIATGDNVGGLIGLGDNFDQLTVSDSTGNVTGNNYVGGWIGKSYDTNILANGKGNESIITGGAYVGGIAGYVYSIDKAINTGEIHSGLPIIEQDNRYAYVGGIAGKAHSVLRSENRSDIVVTNEGAYVGGIAGYADFEKDNALNNNVNYGEIKGKDYVGGIAGYAISDRELSIARNTNNGNVTGDNYVGGVFGTASGYREYVDSWYVKWRYHLLEVVSMTNNGQVVGIGDRVGGIAGEFITGSQMVNCNNTADVTGLNYVGGWVGDAHDGNILAQNNENNNTITGNVYVGGFAGYAGAVENAINNGNVVSKHAILNNDSNETEAYVGGIVGYANGIKGCVNNMDIAIAHDGNYVGGIAGYVKFVNKNIISRNENNADVIAPKSNFVGGIAGFVIGKDEAGEYKLSDNINNGNIEGLVGVGGITGMATGHANAEIVIANCANTGTIKGSNYLGGISGNHSYLKTDPIYMDTNTTTSGTLLGR